MDLAEAQRLLAEFIGDIDPASKKGRRRLAIIEVATSMFAERGYRATNMDEIAAAVGIAKGTLYLSFPKKIDLLFACASLEKAKWVPELMAMLESDVPAATKLKRWIVTVMTVGSTSPLLCRLLDGDADMAAMMAEYPPELTTQANEAYPTILKPVLEELAGPEHRWSPIELHDRANVIRAFGMFAPHIRHEWQRPGMSIERFAAIFADMIVDGLRPRPSSQGEST